jgi:hypothetical protein
VAMGGAVMVAGGRGDSCSGGALQVGEDIKVMPQCIEEEELKCWRFLATE